MATEIAIVGAGLSGNLMAIMLAGQGFDVTVYERGPAPGESSDSSGRSINLALAARGIQALKKAEAFVEIESLLLPMKGRYVHESNDAERFLAYGQRGSECIWSVSRHALNEKLIAIARDRCRVTYRFEHVCTGFDTESIRATLRSDGREFTIEPDLLIAADGAGSGIRRQLAKASAVTATEQMLDHGYKELTIPPLPDGGFALQADGLHIWPRGGFMLIALPNLDRSFTATLFLPHQGQPGFDELKPTDISAFFREHFSDALALMPDIAEEFTRRPIGELGTVHCEPWSLSPENASGRSVLLIGDAAHAIVPFHGQGMNAAFEDCAALAELASRIGPDWPTVIEHFEADRRDNARAIADMALENYQEMRDTVRDPAFEQRAELAFELERRFPGRFIPRYSMVMFHPEIGYAEAFRRGEIQAAILDEAIAERDQTRGLKLAVKRVETAL